MRVIDTKNKYTTFGDEKTKMDRDSVPPFETEPAGTTATRCDRWVKRLENYLVAKDIVDDVRKRACCYIWLAATFSISAKR